MGWYQRVFVDTGRAPAIWMLAGFLITFAVTRGITRRIHAKGPGSPGGQVPCGFTNGAGEYGGPGSPPA